jgi:hypothetical protein
MKVLKTIVATAVIVFTVTTVAMAGVHKFTQHNGGATQRLGATVPAGQAGTVAHSGQTVTLTERQFDRLLRLVRSGRQPTRVDLRSGQRVAGSVASQPQAGYQGQAATGFQPPAQGSGDHGCYNYKACPVHDGQTGATGTTWHGGSSGGGGQGCW